MNIFLDEHKNFLLLLLNHKVDFILIGGYAVIYYGYERGTGDMDLWLKPDNTNKQKFIEALRHHGLHDSVLEKVAAMNFNDAQVMHLGEKPNKIDFLTKVSGLVYDEAEAKKNLIPLQNTFIPVIDYHHLIVLKMIAARPQDKADVDILQKINQFKNKK